jgi:photosystem II stability/assembly factor-like uncharacterized protein
MDFPGSAEVGYYCCYTGYVWGILKTTDGGANWTCPDSGVGCNDLCFPVDGQTGYAVGGSGAIRKTTDGGVTWIMQQSDATVDLKAVHFPRNNTTGWIVGNGGTVLKTTDGGVSWNRRILAE